MTLGLCRTSRLNDLARFPWFFKRYSPSLSAPGAPPQPAPHHRPGRRCARRHRGNPSPGTGPAVSLQAAAPVRRRRADYGAALRDLVLPRRRVGGRPFPARGVRRRPRRHVGACRRALVRPERPRPGTGRAAAARANRPPSWSPASRGAPAGAIASAATGTSTGTPAPCSLTCWRRPTPRACTAARTRRFPDLAVAALVGADGVHEFPVAVVALGDGTPRARRDRPSRRWRGRRGAGGVPARHAARSGRVTATELGSPWAIGPSRSSPPSESPDTVEAVVLAGGRSG